MRCAGSARFYWRRFRVWRFSACAAQTDPASNIGALTATLNAHGHTNGTPAHYFFQYSTRAGDLDTQPGRRTPTRTIPPTRPPQRRERAVRRERRRADAGRPPITTGCAAVTCSTTLAVCARTLQFTTASTPQFSPHLFAASDQQLTPRLDDITSIGSRLYVAGEPCPDARLPLPASHCSFVGSLALDGTKKQVDAPDRPGGGDHSRPGRRPLGPDRWKYRHRTPVAR